MPSVLLLGATGLLGSHLASRLPASFATMVPGPRTGDIDGVSSLRRLTTRMDALDHRSVEAALDEGRPDVVVNAIGAIGGEPAQLTALNAEFPRRLAAMVEARGGRVVHISTDGVFSGSRGGYRERDVPDPVDDYGRAKLAGELDAPHLTIRTSFFGRSPRGRGLVEWLLTTRGRSIEGYTDYRFTGVAASVLADLVAAAIAAPSPLEGVHHVGGAPITKFELLKALVGRLELNATVVPVERGAVDRTLDASRFFQAVGGAPPTLAESIATFNPCGQLSRN